MGSHIQLDVRPSGPAAAQPRFTSGQRAALHAIAAVLLPGDADAPSARDVPDFDANLDRGLPAMGAGAQTVLQALDRLPGELTWDSVRTWAAADPDHFEAVATLVSGAYFMSPAALDAIGYPHGPRRRAPHDLAAEELGSGLLDPMLARPSMVREVPE